MSTPFVVGVGASAGGLDALAALLAEAGTYNVLAFVIVQHLSPDYPSMLTELLGRATRIPVKLATNGEPIQGGHAYVIEPQTTLTVQSGRLVVRKQERSHHPHLPIDILLQSLAEDQGANAAGVILSGTGSDGTRGCRAIKELGGLVIAQNAESCSFDGMPRSIRTAGLADLVLPPSTIVAEIARIVEAGGLVSDALADDERLVVMNKVIAVLRRDAALDFGHYKDTAVVRRVKRRLGILGLTPQQYADRLELDSSERSLLVRDMLIGVTRFFRDPEAFEVLRKQVRAYVEQHAEHPLRIWVAGCSTGEEAYSVAMTVGGVLHECEPGRPFKVFATDVNQASLKLASAGVYSTSAVADVPPELLARSFERTTTGTFTVRQELRDRILFSRHNVFQDSPFSSLDLVVCRNLLIYLRSSVQERVYQNFAFALRSGGLLMLGPSESPPSKQGSFELLDARWQVFRSLGAKRDSPSLAAQKAKQRCVELASPVAGTRKDVELLSVFRSLVPAFMPPFLVMDGSFSLVYRSGDLGGLLRVPDGRATLDLRQMLPVCCEALLVGVVEQLKEQSPASFGSFTIPTATGTVDFELQARIIRESPLGRTLYVLVFVGLSEGNPPPADLSLPALSFDGQQRIRDLDEQLSAAKENLQATVEALESLNEELQAANEELVASNEELQSLNEELQSVNEELHTVNAGFQVKIEELSRLNSDMDQLLSSIEMGALFVDQNLGIRRFNGQATRFINLLEHDVGRPLGHLRHEFGEAPLLDLCSQALGAAQGIERLLVTTTGARVLFRARGLPADATEGGLVLTFTDVTSVHAERESRHLLDEALQHADVPLALLDLEGCITMANRAFATQFDRDAKWLAGLDAAGLLSEEERATFKDRLSSVGRGHRWSGVVHSLRADGTLFQESVQMSPLKNKAGEIVGAIRLTDRSFEVGAIEGATVTGTYSWDVRTDESSWSESLYDVLGMEKGPEAINLQSVYPLILDEDRPSVDKHLAQAMDSTLPHEFSFRSRRASGEVQRVGSRMLPDRAPSGELRRMIGVLWVIHGADNDATEKAAYAP